MFGDWFNQGGPNPYNQGIYPMQQPYTQGTVSRKQIIDYLSMSLNASEVVLVDDFESLRTRHICKGTKIIQLLQSQTFPVPTVNGEVYVQAIFCQNCRKLIINKNSIEIL